MKKPHYAWLVMAACCATVFSSNGLFINGAGIFYQPVAQDLGVGIGSLSFYMTVRSLASMCCLPLLPTLLDRFNLRVTLSVATVITCACYALMGRTTAVWQFYVLGGIMGLVGPLVTQMSMPIILGSWFKRSAGLVIGIVLSFTGLGGAVSAPLGTFFIQQYGWRQAYLLLGAIGLVVALPFTLFAIRRRPEDMGLRPYGAEDYDDSVPESQRGAPDERAALRAMKSSRFALLAVFAVATTAVSCIPSFMSGVAQELGFNPAVAASAVSVLMIGVIVGKISIGSLSDRVGINRSVALASCAGILGVVAILFSTGRTAWLMAGGALLGASAALPAVANPLATVALFGQRNYPRILSTLSLITSLVGAVCVSGFGFIYDLTGTYNTPLYIVIGCLVLGIVSLKLAGRRPAVDPPPGD